MNYKKIMLAALVLLAILTIGAVSASDGGDELVAAEVGEGNLSIAEDPAYDSEILGNGTDVLPDNNDSQENTNSTGFFGNWTEFIPGNDDSQEGDDDPYQIEVNWEFDINDGNATVVSIFCPDETQGYFIIKATNEENGQYLSHIHEILQSDYDKSIRVTVSDLGFEEPGEYRINVYLTDDWTEVDDEFLIFDDLATVSAIDYTQFRYIGEKTWALNVLTTGNIIAVYCPEGSEGSISISVRRGDEEELFHTSVKPISDKDDENKLHWTLSELNMAEEGEFFINVYHGDDIIERGVRLTVDIPIYINDMAYVDSDYILVTVMLPYEMEDAYITLDVDQNLLLSKSSNDFIDGETGTYSPYWNVRSGSGWVDENYKEYLIAVNHLEYDFEEGAYNITVNAYFDGNYSITSTGEVRFYNRDIAGNENISIEIFGHMNYELENNWDEVVSINANEDCQGNILITVADSEWTFESPLTDLESEYDGGDYYIYPYAFKDLGPGEYEITVSYLEDGESIISITSIVSFYYGGEDGDEGMYPGVWNDGDERGTLYTDSEGRVLWVDMSGGYEGNIIVIVNDEEIDNWAFEDDYDNEGWAYKDWGLEDLGISEEGEYNIVVIYDNGEDSEIILNETITVSEFVNETFRAMILYSTEVIKFYCPADGEGNVSILTNLETEGGDLERINEIFFEITDEHRGKWTEFALSDLGFEADGAFREFILTVSDANDEVIYSYRALHVDGEGHGEDDWYDEQIEFAFIGDDEEEYLEFNKISDVAVALLYIPDTDEYADVSATVYVSLNGRNLTVIRTGDFDREALEKENHYPIVLDLTQLNDKDVLSFLVEAIHEDSGESAINEDENEWTVVVEDKGDTVIFHDDFDPERLEFDVFYGNLTTGTTNDPELMGPHFDGNFVILVISNSLGIDDGTITVSDGKSIVFSKSLSEIEPEYDYGSIGNKYMIELDEVMDELPEGVDLTIAFNYANNTLSQNRIRFEDYLYKIVLPEDITNQFQFIDSEDELTKQSDVALKLFTDANRQSIYIDLGAGYFNVYVNGVKVENLGNVSFNTWVQYGNWQENDDDYVDNFAPDEEAFLNYVRSYWGKELELFRLTSWNQGAPELNITLADLGITESGTYNIRITQFPSVPGGLDDHSDIWNGDGMYAEEYQIPVETEFFNENITVNYYQSKTDSSISAVYDKEAGELVATLTNAVSGKALTSANVVISLNGEVYTLKTSSKGQVRLSTSDLALGVYSAIVSYKGNSKYNPSNATVVVNTKYDTSISAVYDNEAGELVATLTNATNGKGLVTVNVAVSLNGVDYTLKTNSKGQVRLAIDDLALGVYSAVVSYKGNSKYNPSNATVVVNTKFDTDISAVYDKDAGELVATLTNSEGKALTSAKMLVTLDGVDYALKTNSKGQVKVSTADLTSGYYNATASYNGNSKYNPSSTTVEIFVKKNAVLSVPDVSVVYGDESGELIATLTNDEGKALYGVNVIVTLGDVEYTLKTNSKGQVKVSTADLAVGTYTATVSYKGNSKYNPVTATATVVVNKMDSNISAVYDKDAGELIATLTNAISGKALTSANVVVSLDGVDYTLKTNSKGQAKLAIDDLALGVYSAVVSYKGNSKYNPSSVAVVVNTKYDTRISTVYDKDAGELVATLTNGEGKALNSANVVVSLDGVDYTLKTNSKGQVKVSTEDLALGVYSAVVSYKGNSKYNPSNATVVVNTKFDTSISAFYDAESKELVATLTNSEGKALSSAKIVVSIDGVDYALKTNSKGQARLSTEDLALGDYMAVISYKGNSKYNPTSAAAEIHIE